MSAGIVIRRGKLEEIIDLRWKILRAGLPRETAYFDGDREETTRHFVAASDGEIFGCVTILRRAWQDKPAWQLRGMAVDTGLQRTGIGRRLLAEVERTVRAEKFSLQLWCNARTSATLFYRKLGWQIVGEQFAIPSAGPHYKMTRLLTDE